MPETSPARPSGLLRVVALMAIAAMARIHAADLSAGQDGVIIPVKGMGDFTLSYPVLQPGDRKPLRRTASGKHAELTYAGDIIVSIEILAGGHVEMAFQNAKDVKNFVMGTTFGGQFGEGGTWKVGANEAKPFPAVKPEKPFLFQGNAGSISFTDPAGHALGFSGVPDYAYQQLQDNREWGTNNFQWQVFIPYNPGWKTHEIVISDAAAGGGEVKIKPQVDRFGQTTRKEYPGKVTNEDELKADVKSESAYYASFKPMATDTWGGLPGSKEELGLKATGFFHVESHADTSAAKKSDRWLLVDPDGNACFHRGICGFGFSPGEDCTYIKDRHEIFEWLPPIDGEFAGAYHPESWWHDQAFSFYVANLIRKYGAERTKDQQLSAMIDRVRAMGFNAIGAFSGNMPCFGAKHFPRMEMTGIGPELPGIRGVSDPFDDATLKRMDEGWSKSIAAAATDPLIVGYFFANEQGFEDIPRGVPQLGGKYAAKRKLVEQLQKTYPTIAEFNTAWGLQAADFASLNDKALPVTTKQAFADMQAYTERFLDAYYSTIATTFRKYDKNHLMVSNRWQPGTANNEALCRAAGKYMDVISINYYTLGVDRAFMKRLYDWTGGKPQMWSEFYYTSGAESNSAAGGLDMKTQKARGEAYRAYIEDAADLGFVVGIEWFTLIDQAVTGRWFQKLDGERANTGVFNVCDRPYKDMVAEMATAHAEVYDVLLHGKKPFAIDDARFNPIAGKAQKHVQAGRVAPGSIVIDGSVDGWPGRPPERIGSDRVVIGKDGQGFEAAFKVAWDDTNLYLLANVTDPTPMNNAKSAADLWNGDGLELFIGSETIDKPGTLLFSDHQVLLGAKAGKPGASHIVNAAKQPTIDLAVVASVDGKGYTMEAAIPWSALDVKPKEGAQLIFDLAIDDAPVGGDRSRQLMWNGGGKNSADRSYWGRLELVP